MQIRIRKSLAFVSMLLSLSAAAVLANTPAANTAVPDDEYTAHGEGTFKLGRDRANPLASARIEIDSRDRFDLKLILKDKTELEFKGRLAGEGRHRTMTFNRGLGNKEISGSGEVSFNDNRGVLRSVSGSGEVDGDHFRFDFNSGSDGGDPDTDNRHSFSDNINGAGRLDIGDDKVRITHLAVNMARNGDLHLTAEGPDGSDITWNGRWRGDGPVYDFDVRRVGMRNSERTGQITLSKNMRAFKKIEFTGTQNGEEVRFYFEAK